MKRQALSAELGTYCLDGDGSCYDMQRARDYMRSYACSIFDLLVEAYRQKINPADWREEIANESAAIVLTVWKQTGAIVDPKWWKETVDRALDQHVGRPFRKQESSPPAVVSQLGAETPTGEESLVDRRAAMLAAYKANTGASNRKIYEASNSGIHKPEFSKWRRGLLPDSSATTRNFERFLREQRPPIPRKLK